MQTSKQIKVEIRELKAEMKASGIRRTSCFNGGLDRETYRCNSLLFALTVRLEAAVKAENELATDEGWSRNEAIALYGAM